MRTDDAETLTLGKTNDSAKQLQLHFACNARSGPHNLRQQRHAREDTHHFPRSAAWEPDPGMWEIVATMSGNRFFRAGRTACPGAPPRAAGPARSRAGGAPEHTKKWETNMLDPFGLLCSYWSEGGKAQPPPLRDRFARACTGADPETFGPVCVRCVMSHGPGRRGAKHENASKSGRTGEGGFSSFSRNSVILKTPLENPT